MRWLGGLLVTLVVTATPLWAAWAAAPPADEWRPVDAAHAVVFGVETLAPVVEQLTLPTANAEGSVTTWGDLLTIRSDVLFAYNSAALTPKAKRLLARVAQQLIRAEPSPRQLTVTGHTDARGTERYNLELSRRRAVAVAATLRSLVPGVRVVVRGAGEGDPVASNSTAAGRAKNRRVTLKLDR